MTTLTQAFDQWCNRPADQRFNSLESLHEAVIHHREVAVEAENVEVRKLALTVGEAADGTRVPMLRGENGQQAEFTHYSFGQMARRLSAPAAYLRTLSPGLACANLNERIRNIDAIDAAKLEHDEEADATGSNLLFAQNGSLVLRAITSPKYKRIWNYEITSRLLALTQQHPEWQPAPAAFDGSRGLYASEKDIFCFLVDNDRRIFESLPGGGLGRGFFVSNSEVGDASFRITTFLYEYVCGNHRVWGASGVQEIRIPHIGNADERAFGKLTLELRKYADTSATETEAKIEAMRRMTLGATKDQVLDALFKLDVPKSLARQSIALAEVEEAKYGTPTSVWALTGAMTQIARDLPNADERVKMERLAGKVMKIAF